MLVGRPSLSLYRLFAWFSRIYAWRSASVISPQSREISPLLAQTETRNICVKTSKQKARQRGRQTKRHKQRQTETSRQKQTETDREGQRQKSSATASGGAAKRGCRLHSRGAHAGFAPVGPLVCPPREKPEMVHAQSSFATARTPCIALPLSCPRAKPSSCACGAEKNIGVHKIWGKICCCMRHEARHAHGGCASTSA